MKQKQSDHLDSLDDAVRDAVAIEPLAIEEEFIRLPADLAYRNEMYASAYRRFLVAKHEADRTYSRLMMEHRATLEASNDKRPTEGAIKASVENDPDWDLAQRRLIDAEVGKISAYGVVDAIRTKRDALISIGAHIRAEMGGDPSTRARHRGARDVEDSRGE